MVLTAKVGHSNNIRNPFFAAYSYTAYMVHAVRHATMAHTALRHVDACTAFHAATGPNDPPHDLSQTQHNSLPTADKHSQHDVTVMAHGRMYEKEKRFVFAFSSFFVTFARIY